MTEPGADQRARGITTDDPSVYLEIGNDLDGVDLRYQCTRAELWAAIEDYSDASFNAGVAHCDGYERWEEHDEAQAHVRALLGLESES